MSLLIVFTTVPNIYEAEDLAGKIVGGRLAACVQVLPQMKSYYLWEGKLRNEPEHMLLIKTLPEKYESLHDFILANHSYSVPEIIAVDAERVGGAYQEWVDALFS